MRALSLAQATRCETATHDRCKCRCHGAAHGINRLATSTETNNRSYFEWLPPSDPHHLPTKEEIKARRSVKLGGTRQ